ncbi:PqqD family protein [Thiohalocapsa sp. ML1]|jgi:hypothetical protein|uniref:PqqD family protein n=1 Tax=Thiohalocapsa sp. ML1 TaxID=1431688 RepID=UPI000731FED9|nr:PqqD family protein [Thiohalocapsa sp. ML1]
MSDDDVFQLLQTLIEGSELEATRLPDGSAVVLDMPGHRVLTLSPTGAALFAAAVDGDATIEALTDRLVCSFDVDIETARRDTEAFVKSLVSILTDGG